jgi:hypothetical protein
MFANVIPVPHVGRGTNLVLGIGISDWRLPIAPAKLVLAGKGLRATRKI